MGFLKGKAQKNLAISKLKHNHRPLKLSIFGFEKYNQELADQSMISRFTSELEDTPRRTELELSQIVN